jgi:hypothetical protein
MQSNQIVLKTSKIFSHGAVVSHYNLLSRKKLEPNDLLDFAFLNGIDMVWLVVVKLQKILHSAS